MFLLLERAGGNRVLERQPRLIGHAYALLATMVSWVFFRAATLPQALGFLSAMFGQNHPIVVTDGLLAVVDPFTRLMLVVGIIGSFPVIPRHWQTRGGPLATVALTALLVAVLMLVAVKTYTPFIYQKF